VGSGQLSLILSVGQEIIDSLHAVGYGVNASCLGGGVSAGCTTGSTNGNAWPHDVL